MKITNLSLLLILLIAVVVSCTSSLETGDFDSESEIALVKGTAAEISEAYSDSLFTHPFTINDLSRQSKDLHIEVTYSGGEGGCPPHLFVVNWDEVIYEDQAGGPLVKLGVAHYLPTVDNCEALVEEKLEIDLAELLDDELKNNLNFIVTNLSDSTQTILSP
ncbi:MAG: hypothetical protein RI564_11070 [Gracilimonas sp.]|nr:hypothetical protein [Gracilimonas sp.]